MSKAHAVSFQSHKFTQLKLATGRWSVYIDSKVSVLVLSTEAVIDLCSFTNKEQSNFHFAIFL